MSRTFSIRLSDSVCDLVVGERLASLPHALRKFAPAGARVALFSDSAVAKTYGKTLAQGLQSEGFEVHSAVIPSGERSKALSEVERLYRFLARARLERKSWIVALGGGVVGDLAGYVAATWLRGVPFVQVPTTLLAQVDASIGGKTAVDIPEGKNLVGAFYHPRLVWIDPSLLKSLPAAHLRNGMAEVIKYGAILDARLFAHLEAQVDYLVTGYSKEWDPIITRCAQLKADVVRRDPKELKGLRAILNFGHSVGHAIEAATGYKSYLHGEAISIGMFVAGYLSQQVATLSPVERVRLGTLLTRAGLPAQVQRPIPRRDLMEFMARDKKSESGSVRFVLLKRLGRAVSGVEVPPDQLEPALASSGL